MSSPEESGAILSFDQGSTFVVELLFERTKPTRWLLVPSIPIHVTLLKSLRCLDECVSSRLSPNCDVTDYSVCGSAKTNCCEGWINVVRVGYMLKESHTYCLLLQFSTSENAEHVKNQLMKTNLIGSPSTVSEYVQPWGKVMTSQCDAHTGDVDCQHYSASEEEIALEALCTLMREGMASVDPSRGDMTDDGKTWQALGEERHGESQLALSASLMSTENFCTICQEYNVSGRPCFVALCNHVFHLSCFLKHLEDVGLSCPLCRFSMGSLESRCGACGTCCDLWTCLVCGWVACGQGHRGHHVSHFTITGHSCAMQLSTSRIWNYRTKMFLHHQLAIELGRADDAEAAKAAEEEAAASGRSKKDVSDVTASSYWRSRWWWDEADDKAALHLNTETVQKYYTGFTQDLMREQFEFYERRSQEERAGLEGTIVSAETVTGGLRSFAMMLRKLMAKEQQQRRQIVAEYVACMQQAAREEGMSFKHLIKQEAKRNEDLREELLLLLHTVQSLQDQVKKTRARIEKTRTHGEQQTTLRQETLRKLQEELELLMKTMDQ